MFRLAVEVKSSRNSPMLILSTPKPLVKILLSRTLKVLQTCKNLSSDTLYLFIFFFYIFYLRKMIAQVNKNTKYKSNHRYFRSIFELQS